MLLFISQYPQEKNNGPKVPVELRVNIWLGLSAVEKKFNSFAEGTFTVFAEMVPLIIHYLFFFGWGRDTFTFHLYGKHLHTKNDHSPPYHPLKSHPRDLNLRG